MSETNKRVVILGGGTAGWIAANLMAKHWEQEAFDITLVESPNIGIIGVGEGSTPPLKVFLDLIGCKEEEWMPACNATYKVGIRFNDWSIKPGYESYFHPFYSKTDDHTIPAFFHNSFLIRQGVDLEGLPDHFFLGVELAKQKKAPLPAENFPFETSYGYHFDSNLLGQYLAKVAASRGVKYKKATVREVVLKENGDVSHLLTDEGESIGGDLFVDSSGFKGQIIQQALKVPFISCAQSLFNDSAVVLPTDQVDEPNCQTTSTAMKNGWRWDIPLTNRTGNGYVYSSNFCDADAAETELRTTLNLLDSDVEARHLKFKVGRVQEHWVRNCLAVGLSQGFIEPLEATALDMVQETVVRFIEAYDKGQYTEQSRKDFNNRISHRFDAVRDYITAHFRIVSRTDTEYWRACGSNDKISPSLYSILSSWMQGKNITQELEQQQLDAYFPNISWNCLLAGKGIYPDKSQLRKGNELAHKYKTTDINKFIKACAMNYPTQAEVLKRYTR
ncbi:tryptophan halogenase family protein [Saccharophagus degradans]|uniref:Tryptophan 7-halogenase n=1 Tax=Saccharophagus degradans TaxID=86304 RepID=A0AAW7X3D8_9GAMM|nr:tryptophan halogenase family protein [Saccharophagus degradans]MDO6422163.1 tryptophan 7-halogenase [Saccharophagus degradans]MDO6607562.1 tryptophan 7-halogenase [Saccharophagus degradans]